MFKKLKASPATREASTAGSRASEKKMKKEKPKKRKKNGHLYWQVLGYTMATGFILVAVSQTTGAFSNINAASILYQNQIAKDKEEKEKAQQAVSDQLDISINDDNTITPNIKDKTDGTYYMDEDGNVICFNKNGTETVYYICTTCDKCGHVTADNTLCSKCGSDLYKYVVYQVEKGDTLSEISGKVGASVDSIAHLNELDNVNLIYAGESLRIPE